MYRTHTADMIGESLVGQKVTLCGWAENIRDHGGVLFLDLRDYYGVVQIVFRDTLNFTPPPREECVSVTGIIELRDKETYNPKIPAGTVELNCGELKVLGAVSNALPFEIISSKETREDLRLKYRYLDIRNRKVKQNLIFRSEFIKFLRGQMEELGFLEVATPIICAGSPEGARDYIIPSRKFKGRFFALPQAPQQFKQLLMVGGIDKYFQIAPCFRDEDSRADRTSGEFYQLDFEMAFAEEQDVLKIGERVILNAFKRFAPDSRIDEKIPVISYEECLLRYGTDKPDLRNPLKIIDLTDFFSKCTFRPFMGKTVRAIKVHEKISKGSHEKLLAFATSLGMSGLGYLEVSESLTFKGPIDKYIPDSLKPRLIGLAGLSAGDTIFFIADSLHRAEFLSGKIRTELGERLNLIEGNAFKFVIVNDFPMYEEGADGLPAFKHNPFSMPKGGLSAFGGDIYSIKAYQYDFVCNGVEISSGAVRNHDRTIMKKVFGAAGYSEQALIQKFGTLYTAFGYGAPPHGGMAFGVERLLMLLLKEQNIREVIAFPPAASGQDLLFGAPTAISEVDLREAHIKLR